VAYEQQAAIAAAYISSTVELRSALLEAVLELFRRLTSWRDADADEFVAAAVPMVQGAQQAMARITDSYMAAILSDLLGEDIEPLGFSLGEDLRGVPAEEVYRRPFTQIWTDLSEGALLRDAVEAGERRAEGLAATDLELAKTRASQEALEGHDDERIVGYRRVLTGAENCAMCVLASTQRYHVADLLPIHPACDCGVAPIIGDADPGQTINSVIVTEGVQALSTNERGVNVYAGDQLTDLGELLEPLHEEIEKRFGKSDRGGRTLDYRKVLTVHQHGEIGPVLAIKGNRFTGPDDLPAS
jgi:hypothetical protein